MSGVIDGTAGIKMKTIKNGLIMAILGFALYGCYKTPTLEELSSKSIQHGEQAVIKGVRLEYCDDLKVTLSCEEYSIKCDNSHYFDFNADPFFYPPTILSWGEVWYSDESNDDKIESISIWIDGELNFIPLDQNVETNTNIVYKNLLSRIKREDVHRVWERRWRH